MNGDSKKLTSIKCQYPPGGNTNFSFNWKNEGQPEYRRMKSRSNSRTKNFNIISNENTDMININAVKVDCSDEAKKSAIKTNYEIGKPKMNLFDEQKNVYGSKPTSIKVQHAPGGTSNIVLGNDSTNYEEYRRKR
jgi:hypothetical protein